MWYMVYNSSINNIDGNTMKFLELLIASNQKNVEMSAFANLVSARDAENRSKTSGASLQKTINIIQSNDESLDNASDIFPHVPAPMLDLLAESWTELLTHYISKTTAIDTDYIEHSNQGLLFVNLDQTSLESVSSENNVYLSDSIDCSLFANFQAINKLVDDLDIHGYSSIGLNRSEHIDLIDLLNKFISFSLQTLQTAIAKKAPQLLN